MEHPFLQIHNGTTTFIFGWFFCTYASNWKLSIVAMCATWMHYYFAKKLIKWSEKIEMDERKKARRWMLSIQILDQRNVIKMDSFFSPLSIRSCVFLLCSKIGRCGILCLHASFCIEYTFFFLFMFCFIFAIMFLLNANKCRFCVCDYTLLLWPGYCELIANNHKKEVNEFDWDTVWCKERWNQNQRHNVCEWMNRNVP